MRAWSCAVLLGMVAWCFAWCGRRAAAVVRSGPVGLVPITRHLLYLVDIEVCKCFFSSLRVYMI